ncbi:MAG: hypothetical protein VW405_16665, partial [Rhodospirillaceae bacterium]
DYIFGMREASGARAWPLDAFAGGRVINDRVGLKPVVLIGDAASRTVRAYERGDREFTKAAKADALTGPGGAWTVTEDFLVGPDDTKLPRAAGAISYWFPRENYYGERTTLCRRDD